MIQGFTGDYGQNNWVLNPGDKIQVSVWNPQSNAGPATQTVTVGASTGSSMPVLTSVSPIVAQPNQTITLSGSGFGTQTPYNGDSQYLEIADLTGNWIAGWINNGSPNQVTLNVTSWTDSQIVIQGFTGDYGQNNWVLNPGDKIQVSVWNAQSDAGPATQTVTVGAAGPTVSAVLNAASYAAGGVAPGEIVYISGSGVGPSQIASYGGNGDVPVSLAGTSVTFNGTSAPLIYTSATAVAAVVPYEVLGTNAKVIVSYKGIASPAFTVPVVASIPGLFTSNSSGSGPLAATHADGTLITSSNPAVPGEYVVLYGSGGGQTSPAGSDGTLTPGLAHQVLPVSVTIGGLNSSVYYAGGAPEEVAGVMQINAQVPQGAGGTASVVVTVGNAQSQAGATVAISGASTSQAPGSIQIVSGNSQSIGTNTAFPVPLVIHVLNASGNPLSGVAVTWTVSAGSVLISSSNTLTNSSGQASVNVTAGSSQGAVQITATVGAFSAQFTLSVASSTSGNPVSSLYSSGQNVTNGRDNSYQIVADTTGELVGPATAFLVTALAGGWTGIPGAAWIGPSADQSNATRNPCCANTSDDYQATFTVSGNPSNVTLNLTLAADDYVDVLLNGNSVFTHPSTAMWGTPVTLSIRSGFISGTNTLEFLVTNGGGPTGLIVAVTSAVSGQTQVTPGQMLTISGNFNTASSVTTTVALNDNSGYQVSVLPLSVTTNSVTVPVPPYLNTQQGQFTSGLLSASVSQQSSSGPNTVSSPVTLEIAALPQTGVSPGLITLDVLTQLSQFATTANQTWSSIAQQSGGIVNSGQLDLSALASGLSAAQADVQALVSGNVSQINLGDINGTNVYLDINSLALMDQIFWSYYLGSTSPATTVQSALRTRLIIQSALKRRLAHIHSNQDGEDPLNEFHDWFSGLITATLPATISSNVLQLRGAASAAIGLAVLIAAPAEVVLASAAAVGGMVWLATTWATAATTAALEGAGNDILNEQPADVSDFQNTMGIIGNGYFDAALDQVLDLVAETGGEAGQTANAIVKVVKNINDAINPENEDGVTEETTTAADENLFNAGSSSPLNGNWTGSYSRTPASGCPSYSGSLTASIATDSSGDVGGVFTVSGVPDYQGVSGPCDDPVYRTGEGNISGMTTGSNSDGQLTFQGAFSGSLDDSLTSFDWQFTAVLVNGSIQGTFTTGSGNFNLSTAGPGSNAAVRNEKSHSIHK